MLGAEVDDQFVGYAFVTVGPGYSSCNSGERHAHLETLAVAPSFRGQGVGEQLLGAMRQQLDTAGVGRIALSAVCANAGAHRFYERHGFRRAEVVFVGRTQSQLAARSRTDR